MLDHLQPQGIDQWIWDDPRQAYVRLRLDGTTLRGRISGIPNGERVIAAWGAAQGWQVALESHPFPDVEPSFAVVTESLLDLWVDPELGLVESNRATQARWGTGIRVCEIRGDWIWGQLLDDGYHAWIPRSGVREVAAWSGVPVRIVPASGWVGGRWLWAGTAIPLGGWDPDVEAAALGLPEPLPWTPATVIKVAQRFLPSGDEAVTAYLWGGTAGSRLDCSGFVQTVARLCGRILPRDADQQAGVCHPLPWEAVEPGDLVFFGETQGEITHVGIACGAGEVIHCSRFHNGVRIDQLGDPQTDYAHYLRHTLQGGGRGF